MVHWGKFHSLHGRKSLMTDASDLVIFLIRPPLKDNAYGAPLNMLESGHIILATSAMSTCVWMPTRVMAYPITVLLRTIHHPNFFQHMLSLSFFTYTCKSFSCSIFFKWHNFPQHPSSISSSLHANCPKLHSCTPSSLHASWSNDPTFCSTKLLIFPSIFSHHTNLNNITFQNAHCTLSLLGFMSVLLPKVFKPPSSIFLE